MSFDDLYSGFQRVVDTLQTLVWSTPEDLPWIIVALLGTGLFLTVRMGFLQFRKIGHAIAIVNGKYDDPEHAGDISHFQALSTALSATVGIGNVAGVALAIHYGGPGAIFWMWIVALVGMCTKYVEVSLAMRHRDFDAAGNSSGGPHKYILKGLGTRWRPLALFFAVCAIVCSFGTGNMAQINTLADAANSTLGLPFAATGAICAVLVGIVILGGISRIGKVTSILAPAMAAFYVSGALIVIAMGIEKLPAALFSIWREAFNPTAGFAGTAAGGFSLTLLWGAKRGLFSNEAGQGSAPIAHSAAKTDVPLREGIVALMEPFIDTICICTMTALVILISGLWDRQVDEDLVLPHKDIQVWTWHGGPEGTELKAFGEAAGRRGGEATIQQAGEEGVRHARVIAGRMAGLHEEKEGPRLCEALLVINDAPIRAAELSVHRDGSDPVPFDGWLRVDDGRVRPHPALPEGEKLHLKGQMILTGQALTARAFQESLGTFGLLIVTLTVMLFALSTSISWSYYGDRCTEFLFGIKAVIVYRLVYLVFVFLGAILPLKVVWDFGDVTLGLMTLPNLIAIALLSGTVRRMQSEYFAPGGAGDPKREPVGK